MRTRFTASGGGKEKWSSNAYYSLSGSSTTRIPPVEFHHTKSAYQSSYEVVDDLKPANTRDSWNNFEHYKRSSRIPDSFYWTYPSWKYLAAPSWYDKVVTTDATAGYSSNWYGPADWPVNGLSELYKPDGKGHFVPFSSDFKNLCSTAFRAMLPGIKSEMSLVNSIYELKDFKTLPGTLEKVARSIRKLALPKGEWTLRQILGGTSEGYLMWMFALKPLISDIYVLRRCLENTHKQVNKLLANEGKMVRRHYVIPLDGVYRNSRQQMLNQAPYVTSAAGLNLPETDSKCIGLINVYRTCEYTTALFHAEMEYTYKFDEFSRQHAEILGLLDSLGVQLNPSIIWNAIPWSFCLDWVVNVSRWLDQFKKKNLEPVTVIHRFLGSQTVDRTVSIVLERNRSCPLPAFTSTMVECRESTYRRSSGFNFSPLEAIKTSGLSLREFSLAGALALS